MTPVSPYKFCFTVSDSLESVDTNASDTCTLYSYADIDSYFKHYWTIIIFLGVLREEYIARL